jgi:hypothetical protein
MTIKLLWKFGDICKISFSSTIFVLIGMVFVTGMLLILSYFL